MKRNSTIAVFSVFVLVAFSLLGSAVIGAQEQPVPEQQAPPPQEWSADQLDNLVAPIALYPDPLLGQILAASTYPLEVVEASQWLQRNRNLRGQALVEAAKKQDWDPSVQALVVVPDALTKLNQDIQWTTDLGNAFLDQEADVMSAVQRMRVRAEANGRLYSTPQQTVTTQEQGGGQVIVIQPASPEVIYVPTYDPFYVWGPPIYGYYPPLYYPAFGFGFGIGFNLGFCFNDWGGWGGWGWGPSWFGNTVIVNNYFFHHYGFRRHWGGDFQGRTVWTHDPVHRWNVPYRNAQVAARFDGRRSANPRNSFGTASGPRRTASPYTNTNRSEGSFRQGYRSASSQPVQRTQNPTRQRYQTSQQNRSSSEQYRYSTSQNRSTPQAQRFQSQDRSRSQASFQYRSPSQQDRQGPRVVPFGSQQQQRYQAPLQNRSAVQANRTPRIQQFQTRTQQSFQAPQQYRSTPRIAAPQFNSGSFSRGNVGSFSRGNVGSFSRGNVGSFSRGSSGGGSRGNAGGFSRAGGGGQRRSR